MALGPDACVRSEGASDARSAPRHAAFGASVQLGWWEGARFRSVAGLLKDISRTGASALVEASPPAGTQVWIRLNGSRFSEWLESQVIDTSKNRWFRRVPRLVRLKLVDPCPYVVFQAALDVMIMDCRPDLPAARRPRGASESISRPSSRQRGRRPRESPY